MSYQLGSNRITGVRVRLGYAFSVRFEGIAVTTVLFERKEFAGPDHLGSLFINC